jgi:hypothetical protein
VGEAEDDGDAVDEPGEVVAEAEGDAVDVLVKQLTWVFSAALSSRK